MKDLTVRVTQAVEDKENAAIATERARTGLEVQRSPAKMAFPRTTNAVWNSLNYSDTHAVRQ